LGRLLRPLLRRLARSALHGTGLRRRGRLRGLLRVLREALLRLRGLLRGEQLARLLLGSARLLHGSALRRLRGLLGVLREALLRSLRRGLLRPRWLEQLPRLLLVRGDLALLRGLVLRRVRVVLRCPLVLRLPRIRGLLRPRAGWLTAVRRGACGASVRVLAHVQHCDDHPACWIPPAPHQEK
jgi:hypothetical protein